jgi:uncharacterized protein
VSGLAATHAPTGPQEVVDLCHRLMLDDLSAQADLYAPNGVLEWPSAPPGVPRRMQGRERIRRALAALEQRVGQVGTRLTGLHAQTLHETIDPEVVIAEFELCAELAPAGIVYRLPSIQVFRVRHGEIVSCRDYLTRVDIGGVSVLGL